MAIDECYFLDDVLFQFLFFLKDSFVSSVSSSDSEVQFEQGESQKRSSTDIWSLLTSPSTASLPAMHIRKKEEDLQVFFSLRKNSSFGFFCDVNSVLVILTSFCFLSKT